MNFIKYLNYLLDIGTEYNKYMNRIHFFFTKCLEGDMIPIIEDLQKLIDKPIKEYDKRDWQSVTYVLSKAYYSNHLKDVK